MAITINPPVPARARTFSESDARQVLDLFSGTAELPVTGDDGQPATDDDGQPITAPMDKPAERVGFGEFPTAGAARSAGVTLNRLLASVGAPHKYAVTAFERDGKYVGVMLNKRAKVRPESSNGKAKTKPKS